MQKDSALHSHSHHEFGPEGLQRCASLATLEHTYKGSGTSTLRIRVHRFRFSSDMQDKGLHVSVSSDDTLGQAAAFVGVTSEMDPAEIPGGHRSFLFIKDVGFLGERPRVEFASPCCTLMLHF